MVSQKIPILGIGLPVYNGEQFIKKKLNRYYYKHLMTLKFLLLIIVLQIEQ
ncbi:hypothetical protein BG20_I0211 [Candidatus Nitrosarchaeum limnium BG20]|uniref:Uncharacterized protein n=1 Tax=Candidatus Nitrosarchaeum limnium BG20 TaxID=859192 RepID=S2E322_9ARCH|nr:hypothetical protein BG20_I0211 [Candidatus Nitrosarchaeum limnium BG20]